MRRPVVVLCLIWVSVVLLSACRSSGSEGEGTAKILRVVTTTTQLTDFARVIGGDRVEVHGLLKADVDPHDYEPSPADVRAIADADVILRNGVGFEPWLDRTIKSAAPRGEVVDTSKGVDVRDGDPHIWQNPRHAQVMVANITDAFAKADPAGADSYRSAQAAYDTQLAQLDTEIAAQIDTLSNKKIVTNHDAFSYFIDRYGLEFVGSVIPSFDTQAELSASDIAELVAKIKASGVKAVFSEVSVPPKTAETIGREAGVKVVAGENALYGDSLGPSGSEGATYLGMMRHNAREIVENLR